MIAHAITKTFDSYEEASAPTCHGFPRAVGDNRIPGASGNAHMGLDFLRRLHDGEAMDAVVARARLQWESCTQDAFQDRREEGERQANECLPLIDPAWVHRYRNDGAVLDETRKYRYRFWRSTGVGSGTVAFVLLNPSTADEVDPDNTSKKCLKYARAWDFARLVIVNLFAYRTKDPEVLKRVKDLATAVGPDNDAFIDEICSPGPWRADMVVAGWGGDGKHLDRDLVVLDRLRREDVPLHYLRLSTSKRRSPWHPLYLPDALKPIPYPMRDAA